MSFSSAHVSRELAPDAHPAVVSRSIIKANRLLGHRHHSPFSVPPDIDPKEKVPPGRVVGFGSILGVDRFQNETLLSPLDTPNRTVRSRPIMAAPIECWN